MVSQVKAYMVSKHSITTHRLEGISRIKRLVHEQNKVKKTMNAQLAKQLVSSTVDSI